MEGGVRQPPHRMAGTRPPRRALMFRSNTGETSCEMQRDARSKRPSRRAGFLDRPVLVVLCVSTALAVVVLGAIWLGFGQA
jgi:hypothetical protein